MKNRLHYSRALESMTPTCENCIHTIRDKSMGDMVVCIPHLKTMPANNSTVCELHALRTRTT